LVIQTSTTIEKQIGSDRLLAKCEKTIASGHDKNALLVSLPASFATNPVWHIL
jgi:hypothetical protein